MDKKPDPHHLSNPLCPRLEPDAPNQLLHCSYCCHCGLKLDHTDPLTRKREKRKQYKKRLKARHKA